jgi:hypothetical protein
MTGSFHPVVMVFAGATAAAAFTSIARCLRYDRLLRAIIAKRPAIWERYLKPCGFFWIPDRGNLFQSSMARTGFYATLAAKSLPWPEEDPEILGLHADYRRWVLRNHLALAAFLLPLAAAMVWSIIE